MHWLTQSLLLGLLCVIAHMLHDATGSLRAIRNKLYEREEADAANSRRVQRIFEQAKVEREAAKITAPPSSL